MNRRTFLLNSAAAAGTLTLAAQAKAAPSERVRSRRHGHRRPGPVADSHVCRATSSSRSSPWPISIAASFREPWTEIQKRQNRKPRTTGDFRRLIDDKEIDALVVGTPDHWHAIPTILACVAGKDVYVEKPDGHNIDEGKHMVAAMRAAQAHRADGLAAPGDARGCNRPWSSSASGELGRCLVAKAWESDRQRPIGRPAGRPGAREVDYDMWLGSAPLRPFNPNRFHGNWRWFYDYGTGDLGNDGVHRLDMAFAALERRLRSPEGPAARLAHVDLRQRARRDRFCYTPG